MIGWATLIAVAVFGPLILLILVNGTDHSRRNRYQPRPKIDPPPPR